MENQNKPLVSVLIGTYNRANLIKRCIKSVFSQTYENIEVIIVNDASTDNTVEVLDDLSNQYLSKIKILHNKQNMGIAYNSNFAYSIAQGDFIALIGDDDEWIDKTKIELQLNIFHENKNLGVVTSHWVDFKGTKEYLKHLPITPINQKKRILMGNNIFCGSTALIKREAWETVNGFDIKLIKGTDSEMFRSIIFSGYSIFVLQKITTKVFLDSENRMTIENNLKSIKKALKAHSYLLRKYFKYFFIYPYAAAFRLKTMLNLTFKLIVYYGRFQKRTSRF